ncbi:MAG: hypothetical protein M3Y81_15125 [Chloroflexota bacterium]|nr:hypothetical protein [Chloroflexota bacterium]
MKKKMVQQAVLPDFGETVTTADGFRKDWGRFSQKMQRLIRRKVALLCQNPAHPSLRVQRLVRQCAWECSINRSLRLVYQHSSDGHLHFLALGRHVLIDRIHQRTFSTRTKRARRKRGQR